jgi:hypothetical protein
MLTATIRLACENCDRTDKDGITLEELEQCRTKGWTNIDEFQSYEAACTSYPNSAEAPSGFDVTAWYTHLGLCPDCRED